MLDMFFHQSGSGVNKQSKSVLKKEKKKAMSIGLMSDACQIIKKKRGEGALIKSSGSAIVVAHH